MVPQRSTDVYATLLDQITSWQLAPGSPLREGDIGERLGVSRTPVREALAQLRADGLVEQRTGQSATVSAVSIDTTIAVYQARDALESYAVQLAASSPQRLQFASLERDYLTAAQAHDVPARLISLADDFEHALVSAVPNPYLLGPLRSTRAALLRLRRLAMTNTLRRLAATEQRAEECRAIATGESAAAAQLSHRRINDSLNAVLDALLNGALPEYVTPAVIPKHQV